MSATVNGALHCSMLQVSYSHGATLATVTRPFAMRAQAQATTSITLTCCLLLPLLGPPDLFSLNALSTCEILGCVVTLTNWRSAVV